MKRRTFILAGITATAVIAFPLVKDRILCPGEGDPLTNPSSLGHFCDDQMIREIGVCYRRTVPQENEEARLRALLLENGDANQDSNNATGIRAMLGKKVNEEFRMGRIVIEDGWILAETEARQCALFSIVE
jgi:hypothetical protein